ncbi:EPS15 homology domain 1 [Actinidia rufa]|uniref:EPS15 homology domain 1 n=1 Tax=Actinidia rufa TaxID=165716 RepID=A0A7J0GP12_9ERIC|nr:EPS15 homology domain 1 [Actinidia rufa]
MEIDSAPISKCSKEHRKIYEEWFNYADSDSDGRITGNDASKFFGMSNLPRPELKQVWAIADSKRQGFLGFKEFIVAMQLVALAQGGHALTVDVLNSEVELENIKPPVMDGLDELLAKKKRTPKTSETEVVLKSQQSPSAHWFTSTKSANKSEIALGQPPPLLPAAAAALPSQRNIVRGFLILGGHLQPMLAPGCLLQPLAAHLQPLRSLVDQSLRRPAPNSRGVGNSQNSSPSCGLSAALLWTFSFSYELIA